MGSSGGFYPRFSFPVISSTDRRTIHVLAPEVCMHATYFSPAAGSNWRHSTSMARMRSPASVTTSSLPRAMAEA